MSSEQQVQDPPLSFFLETPLLKKVFNGGKGVTRVFGDLKLFWEVR